ncbi:hypothetical protein EVAR_47020_1 [Eumeta japonica]|uniref:Uncharacterized protein n=1 Tax=Eumeta variegata TaxID=151549 RepID=A0A4C1XHD0_EUMVA|nr:hypothetical protein EVAR_47020_1 [Eumeta japonica]
MNTCKPKDATSALPPFWKGIDYLLGMESEITQRGVGHWNSYFIEPNATEKATISYLYSVGVWHLIMPRKRVKKTQRSQSDLSNYTASYRDVKQDTSLRVDSERHGNRNGSPVHPRALAGPLKKKYIDNKSSAKAREQIATLYSALNLNALREMES